MLDQGRLSEYSNWKEKLDLHIDPIDLRMASVREARNAERRFCFEMITPHFKRVYQATSEEDMNNWISAINNALQNAVESGGISHPLLPPSPNDGSVRRDIGSVFTGKSSSLSHGPHSHWKTSSPSAGNNSVYRRITVGARPNFVRADSKSFEDNPDRLLQILRNNDHGNCWCADCGSGSKTEWVSINLGIVLCIECSGIHRSLGTHISKVRSLTLDTTSFSTDTVELLLQVGNRVSNMIWEAKLDGPYKPSIHSTREQRLAFITSKYVKREFVAPISSTLSHFSTPEETVLGSVKKNDIQGVLYGLALGANPNVTDRSRNTHAVFLALAAADPAGMSNPSSSSVTRPQSAATNPAKTAVFPIAELLILNGAEIPTSLPAFPLSRNAQLYLEQRSGRAVEGLNPMTGGGGGNNSVGEINGRSGDGVPTTTTTSSTVSTGGFLTPTPSSSTPSSTTNYPFPVTIHQNHQPRHHHAHASSVNVTPITTTAIGGGDGAVAGADTSANRRTSQNSNQESLNINMNMI